MPTPPVALVTFTDATYLPMARELALSARRLQPPDALSIHVLTDAVTEATHAALDGVADSVQAIDWPFDLPFLKGMPGGRRKRTCMPFLRDFVPDAQVYLFVDADAWICDWAPIAPMIAAAQTGALAIAPEVDRSYPETAYAARWVFDWPLLGRTNYMFKNARRVIGRRAARRISRRPTLNTGALALHRDAPHWDGWRRYMERYLATGRLFGDQISLNTYVYLEDAPVARLRALCNWIAAHRLPLWDAEASRFVEPDPPYDPIGILHLTLFDRMRVDRSETVEVPVLGGGSIRRTLRYDPEWDRPD